MEPTHHPRVKVCCIMSHAEARLAIQYGASAIDEGKLQSFMQAAGVLQRS